MRNRTWRFQQANLTHRSECSKLGTVICASLTVTVPAHCHSSQLFLAALRWCSPPGTAPIPHPRRHWPSRPCICVSWRPNRGSFTRANLARTIAPGEGSACCPQTEGTAQERRRARSVASQARLIDECVQAALISDSAAPTGRSCIV